MDLVLNDIIRDALDATEGDPGTGVQLVRAKIDETSTTSPALWEELDWLMSKRDWEGFLRDAVVKRSEAWHRRKNRIWKPPPQTGL